MIVEIEKKTVNTQHLREEVYSYLLKKISEGQIRPGGTINLRGLSKELGVSITPLRDALFQLEGAGLVNIMPRKGIALREFTLKDVENYYDSIGMIEAHALQTAIYNISEEQCQAMRGINERIWRLAVEGEFRETYNLNRTFHIMYISQSDNNYLQTLWLNICPRLYYTPMNIIDTLEWESVCHEQHEELIDAIERKDIKSAVSCVRDRHWSFKRQRKYIIKYYNFAELNEGRD